MNLISCVRLQIQVNFMEKEKKAQANKEYGCQPGSAKYVNCHCNLIMNMTVAYMSD